MTRITRQHFLLLIVITTLIGITYSHENDTSTEGRRHGRVNGRIVKLYSGPKPDPILCQSEGFLADAVDCSVFYRCLKASNGKYSVYRFQCGPGTVYDPDTEICNHPRSTKRSLCGGMNSDKGFSSTQKYIENEIEGLHKEIEELPSPIKTKPSKVSNAILNTIGTSKPEKLESSYTTIIYPWVTTSKYEYNVALAGSSSNIPVSPFSGKPWGYTPTRASTYVTPRPFKQNGVQCTSDGFMGDSEDCRKFYRCVNNQRGGYLKYEFSCSESTIWDDDTQGCNHPWAVQRRRCGKGNSYNENTLTYVDEIKANEIAPDQFVQQQTQISYGSKVTQIQTQISKGPGIQNQTQINFGDRINQEKLNNIQNQIQTNYGVAISQVQNQVNNGNEALQTQLQVDDSTQSQTTLSSTTIPTSTLNIKHSTTNKCTRVGFVGDSNDCKKFYRCVSNEKGGFTVHEFSCSEGTLWDEDLEACNHAWAVKCEEKITNQNKSSPATIIENITVKDYITTTSQQHTTASPFHNNEINGFGYINQNGQQNKQPEPITKITLLTTITTESSKIHEEDCKSSGFFGNAYDCAKFYRCVEDGSGRFKKYEYKCGDGTVWDSQIESCNHAWSVKSCSNNNTIGDQKETFVAPSSTDNTIITTVSLIQTTTQKYIHDSGYGSLNKEPPFQSTTVRDHIANQENDCINPGFMGDNKDCKMFYRCVENGQGGFTRHKFTCGEGTVWDADLGACNHAWAVEKCGGGAIKDNQESTAQPSISGNYPGQEDNYNTNQDIDKDTENSKSSTSSTIINNASPTSSGLNECQSNGFMGNDNDCKIFYRCVENGNGGFIRYEFACGDGTVWDPKIAACNHVWAVERCGGSITVIHSNYTTSSTGSETSTQYTTTTTGFTTLTSTGSDVDNECKSNGFIGDNKDCKKFYRCVEDEKGSYTRYEFACGEGTLWDSKIEACNHAWAVTSCEYKTSPGFDHISTYTPTTMKDEEIANNTVGQSNQEISSATEHNSVTIQTSTTVNDVIQCNVDGFLGDTTDCRKFYRCVNDGNGNFLRYEFTCSDGTVWDSEIKACNHVNSVKTPCTSFSTQTTKENEPNYTDSSTSNINDYATTTKNPPKNPECQQEGFFGDRTDCKKFYRCVDNGQGGFHKYEFSCGEGTSWDQQILACNHASTTSLCGSALKEPQLENADTHSTPITSTIQTTEKTQTSTTLQNECKSDGFYANPNDCKKFYRCVGDGKDGYIKYDFSCGEGTVWVQDIQACDHDNDNSFCSKEKNTTIATGQSNETNPVITTVTTTQSIATSIIDTETSKPTTKPIMQDETVSGSSSTTESTSTSSSTLATTGNQDHCDEAGYFGNSQDCKMFYRCVDNGKGGFTKYDFTCGDGTIWDQDITACNHPQDVLNPSCNNEVGSSHTTTTTKTTTTTSTTTKTTEASEPTKGTSTTETSTAESSNQEMSTNKPSNTNYTCTQAGFYADPNDCKKFYRCVDWANDGKTFSIYHFDCGEGTIWDPELQTCNHEQSVYPPRDCSGKQPQSENNNGTTTTTKQDETTESSTTELTTLQSTTEKSTSLATTTTTESSSTTDQTTTQQSSTSEQASSTPQSTTQSVTSEQSTTQESTSQQSTTQQSTTASDQTTQASTTQQSSTSDQTTTTTTEQTTTTTTEQTTTTTPEKTTTTTTEPTSTTTPEESTTTTTEQTTTTTTDQTATSTNEEKTTTAQTTTTESTTSTTDQTTKAEQTTTQESSTEQSSENQSSTTEQTTTQETSTVGSTTESGQETSTEQGSSDKECPHTENDQYIFVCPTGFRRHPKYCNLFYQCTEDDDSHEMKVAIFNCPNNTIYDENKTQCVEEEKADKKCDGEIAQRRRVKRLDTNYKEPITVGRQKFMCPALGHFPFEKNEECSPVLFKCEVSKSGKIRGLLYQCPQGHVYWSISRRCEPVNIMTGCKHSLMNWSGRYEIPIERNNVSRKIIK